MVPALRGDIVSNPYSDEVDEKFLESSRLLFSKIFPSNQEILSRRLTVQVRPLVELLSEEITNNSNLSSINDIINKQIPPDILGTLGIAGFTAEYIDVIEKLNTDE